MNARSGRPSSPRRYRRRILGWGAVGVAGVFAVGGPIFVNRVEDDLEKRTVEVLNDAGVGSVNVHFSGQDGELRCVENGPVDIPDEVVSAIARLHGVSSIKVDDTCFGSTTDGSSAEDDVAEPGGDTEAAPTDVPSDDTTDDPTTSETDDATTAPDLALLADVIASDSQFSTLAGLFGDADLTETLTGDGAFSIFAPTNAAFEALGPDVTGALARDPELLASVLSHHITSGTTHLADLTDGDLEMLDGTTVAVGLGDGVVVTSGEIMATVTEADLVASNGVVHAIDRVLLPVGLVIGGDPAVAPAAVEMADGQIVLRGTVASEEQRSTLLAAPIGAVDSSNVIDELVVDAAAPLSDETTDAFATVIAAMASNLVSGSAENSDAGITVSGTFATEVESEAFEAAVGAIDGGTITTELIARPVADTVAATTVETDLNQLVTDNPILFDPSSTTISDESQATLDRVAAVAKRVSGITIVVEGHTDTDGLVDSNLALSEGRARSVRDALITRGLVDDTLTIVGLGGSEPILAADGVEDKTASRRVEFVVTAIE